MIGGIAFDIYAGQFTAREAANIIGVKPSGLAMWGQRGIGEPERREREQERHGHKKVSKGASKGKPLFSARDLLGLRLVQVLSEQMGTPLPYGAKAGDKVKERDDRLAQIVAEIEGSNIPHDIAMTGEWMWAVARAHEKGNRFPVYLYARRPNQKWEFDMHVGKLGEPPCFGWETPFIFVPVSQIFIEVYDKCKVMLDIGSATASDGK